MQNLECACFWTLLQRLFARCAVVSVSKQCWHAAIWGAKASRAYEYAKQMWKKHGDMATCTNSVAKDNCIGSGCAKTFDGKGVRGVCAKVLLHTHAHLHAHFPPQSLLVQTSLYGRLLI